MNKYNVSEKYKRTAYGNVFDSKKEMERYFVLRDLLRRKKIKSLKLQPKFLLQGAFTDNKGKRHREISYIADFAYLELDANNYVTANVVEDSKGFLTEIYKLKKKLFLYQYKDVDFREV